MGWKRRLVGILALIAAFLSVPLHAERVVDGGEPVVGVIIDDMGYRWSEAELALTLPVNVTFAILPRTPYATRIAEQLHRHGNELMLHQPMQSEAGKPLGPGGLTQGMAREAFVSTLRTNIRSIPHLRGVNNHMGSLLTRRGDEMNWLMEELGRHEGLFFIDSRTTGSTVAARLARQNRLDYSQRDVFLDHDRAPMAIRSQFLIGLRQARSSGSAILIGHPYPETMAILQEMLPSLEEEGIRLLPISEMIAIQQQRREQLWQASLSPSPKAAKSLKP